MKVMELIGKMAATQLVAVISREQGNEIVYQGTAGNIPAQYQKKTIVFLRAASDTVIMMV